MSDTRQPLMGPRTKETTMGEIHHEELRFLGQEIPWDEHDPNTEMISGYESIKVNLVYPARHLQEAMYEAWVMAMAPAAFCTWRSEGQGDEVIANIGKSVSESEQALLRILRERPISAILESATFVFHMRGIPRSMTHQIVRHRGMAFNQQSLRVSNCVNDTDRVPQHALDEIDKINEVLDRLPEDEQMEAHARRQDLRNYLSRWEHLSHQSRELYDDGVRLGLPVEQVRDCRFMGTCTKIDAVMRLREVIQYLRDRTQNITQGQHHYMVCLLAKELRDNAPAWWPLISTLVPGASDLANVMEVDPVEWRAPGH